MGTIPEFYSGKQIFITGGSGFVGKVLIEKLLRSCPDIDVIFILMRSKKGKTGQERISDICQLPLFDVLRETNPAILDKMIAIDGDVTLLKMGISDSDFKRMENVSVIFHSAASVRFDDPIRDAILINTRGTREVMRFAETLKNLKVVIHVSTTYCNPDKYVIEEELYPPVADWNAAIKYAEYFDQETLNTLSEKINCFQPNSYTFTKGLSEQIANDYKEKIPIIIYRPSIVISTVNEPFPGWIDNFNGPVGMLVASGIGILRTIYADPNVICDFIPVDVVIKGMIIAGYEKGKQNENNGDLRVYNCSTSSLRAVTTGYVVELAKEIIQYKPFAQMLWVPDGKLTTSRTMNHIRFILIHVVVACVVDGLAKTFKKKPFLMKLQRRIFGANMALQHFLMNDWQFINNNFMALDVNLPPNDVRDFAFLYLKDMDLKEFFVNALSFGRKFLLKESDDNLTYAKRKFWTIYYINKVLTIAFYGFIFYVLCSKLDIFNHLQSYIY